MASARPNDSDHVLNYYKLLGVNENASNEEILHAFRLRAREVHPDKNPEDNVEATKEFQLLTEAKIGLLDPEKRRNLDERLIDNGVRNWNALPLLCSICTNGKSRVCSRCLKGKGHKNPLIDEFKLASKEFKDKMKTTSKTSPGRNEFVATLPRVLKKFIATDLHRLYPLAANRKKSPCSKEEVCRVPTNVRTCWPGSGINMRRSVVPSAADVVEILNLSLFLESRMLPPPTEIPIYDLSSLSSLELEQMLQYFGLPSRKPFSRDLVIEELSTFIPKCTIASTQSDGYQDKLRHVCQQCARTRFSIAFLFNSFTTCFACTKVCCSECLSSVQRKIPTSGSYELRSLCKTCLITLNSREAASWLTHGQYLIATYKKYLEAALAMYNLSNELCPSETATIRQAQALFSCEKHERVVRYGKGILRTTTFERENTQELQTLVAESLLKIAHDADDSDLLEKAGKYEEVIKWTEQFTEEGGATVHDLKVEAMKRRLHYFEVHERVTNQRVQVLFLNVNAAIREGSLLKVFILLQDMDEEAKNMCLKKLATQTYTQYGKLLLQLARAMVRFKLDPAGAVSEMADIFWTGYSIVLENGSRKHISDVLMHFICQLLEGRQSLLMETLPEITPTNFLQCLCLTEDDIFSPPDIEDRLWKNLYTGCDMKMFLKYEMAVKKLSESKKWNPVKVALSYYDFSHACIHPSQLLLTLITSAQWFARQISLPNSGHTLQYSCKKMIVKLTNLVAALAFEFATPPHLQYYVARMVLGLQFYASSKTPFGSQEDAETIGEHLNWLVTAGRLCPLHKIPIVSPTESVILYSISQDLYSEYLSKLRDELPPQMRPMSEAILRYHTYQNHLLGLCKLGDPTGDGLRFTAMTELLHANDWSWDDVQQPLQLNMVPLDSKGWLVSNHRLLEPVLSSGIRRLVGLEIDKHNFRIHLLKRNPTRPSSSLLCWEDVATGLTLDHPRCYFTLEPVTPQETFYHPFNEQ